MVIWRWRWGPVHFFESQSRKWPRCYFWKIREANKIEEKGASADKDTGRQLSIACFFFFELISLNFSGYNQDSDQSHELKGILWNSHRLMYELLLSEILDVERFETCCQSLSDEPTRPSWCCLYITLSRTYENRDFYCCLEIKKEHKMELELKWT